MAPDGRRAALTKEATEGVIVDLFRSISLKAIAPCFYTDRTGRHEVLFTTADATPRRSGRYPDSMIEPGTIFDFRLTLTSSFPEIWRRVLVPEECTLSDLHYVISYSFGWFDDSTHEFTQGSRAFGPKSGRAPDEREDETKVFLLDLFRRPGHDIRYVYERHDRWRVDAVLDGMQAPVPRGHYPCCIEGNNDGPPDGVGGISRYNQLVGLLDDPAARRALAPGCNAVGWSDFEPTYFDIGDINGSLGLIFPPPASTKPRGLPTAASSQR